jgi:hypothetical protein
MYMYTHVHEFINMYIHVCTMFRHVYTVLQYLVQGVRIPDEALTSRFFCWLPPPQESLSLRVKVGHGEHLALPMESRAPELEVENLAYGCHVLGI